MLACSPLCLLQNGIGAGFNVICLVMCFLCPAKRKQQHQQPGQVMDELNPGANWGALRLQSIARPPAGSPADVAAAGATPGSSGGFFDLTQMRWRTSQRIGSFRNGSFMRLLSGSQRSSAGAGLGAAGVSGDVGAGAGLGFAPDALGKGVGELGPDREAVGGVHGYERKKVGAGDVEQARVVADSTLVGLDQQHQPQQRL